MKVIFMGTSEFAVPTVRKIISDKNLQLVAIFTNASKPMGRGLVVQTSPVGKVAEQYNIPKYELTNLRNTEAYDLISNIDADVIVVASYGLIIPANIINIKKYGCINIHPSLLPKYRGPAPMQWTILNGDSETGVCTMQMDAGVDTGDILLENKIALPKDITYNKLQDICANLGADLLTETLYNIDILVPRSQSNNNYSYARKLTKEDGKINWQDSSEVIDHKIRGLNPWPGAYFTYNNKIIKILSAKCLKTEHDFIPGTVINQNFVIACRDGIIEITSLQIEGKTAVSLKEFLNGHTIKPKIILN